MVQRSRPARPPSPRRRERREDQLPARCAIDEVVDGLIDPNADEQADFAPAPAATPADFDDDDDATPAATANTARLEELKRASLEKFEHISKWSTRCAWPTRRKATRASRT